MAKKSSAATALATKLADQPTETTAASGGLEGLREFWQTTAPFDPVRTLDSSETRYEQGKALREQTPRESHAAWTPAMDRADPVATVLANNAGHEESLIPLRMGRMAESPFAFLRGACAVMAGDLAQTPISGPQVLIDGDAHINNFGLYDTPQRDVVIDINDFDEATIGPWEWDLKRLVAPATSPGSPVTSASPTPLPPRWPTSPKPTVTKPNGTTRLSSKPCGRGESRQSTTAMNERRGDELADGIQFVADAAYQLGPFGTAAKKLKAWDLKR